MEEDYENKCRIFEDAILKHRPDVIAMQEVNQSIVSAIVPPPPEFIGDAILRSDNHALKIFRELKEKNLSYFFTWANIKCGYGKFDEGLAVFSLNPFQSVKSFFISRLQSYGNFKTRKALVVKTSDGIFCNTHMGWWNDTDEPFHGQWKVLDDKLSAYGNVFLMGDFNAPSDIPDEGYALVLKSGFKDSFTLAENSDDGCTVPGKIDGWKNGGKKRLDYIFFKGESDVISSNVIFNGTNEPVISDHFGVLAEFRRKEKYLCENQESCSP